MAAHRIHVQLFLNMMLVMFVVACLYRFYNACYNIVIFTARLFPRAPTKYASSEYNYLTGSPIPSRLREITPAGAREGREDERPWQRGWQDTSFINLLLSYRPRVVPLSLCPSSETENKPRANPKSFARPFSSSRLSSRLFFLTSRRKDSSREGLLVV